MFTLLVAVAAAAAAPVAEPAADESPAFDVGVSYIGDVMAVLDGGLARKARYLDNANLTLDADLERLIAWPGALVHIDLLYNGGGNPNDDAGTLQGVDNIEVSLHRGRLFEAWMQQSFGNGHSLRLGLYDLNSEFYSTESAGALMAPAFGIGSEIAATGPNGPSIFPSTALAARLDVSLGGARYVRFAALNASAGVLG
ncbi:MAG: carbohydrate porin, partial [Parvularculaceae bacterium]|nr:carbohydrate porin [Parvularculaceae bacterium]